jgi:hypothetical protein
MTGELMSTDNLSSVSIQTEASPIASVPAWFGDVALLAHTIPRLIKNRTTGETSPGPH